LLRRESLLLCRVRTPAMMMAPRAAGPASESRRGTNPRAMERGGYRALAMEIWLMRKVRVRERNALGREQCCDK